ncbi:MAG: hypothetical protein U9N86_17920 [Bacteroidota bacterium]|nr:hypothetical protein [Bacteroidota bacterium]
MTHIFQISDQDQNYLKTRERLINKVCSFISMVATTMEIIHKELDEIRDDVRFIKQVLSENLSLSEQTEKALQEARNTPESEYVDLE